MGLAITALSYSVWLSLLVFDFRIWEIFNFWKRILIETFFFFFIQKSSEKESTDLRSPSPSAKRSLDEAEQPVEKKLKTCEENAAEVGAASEAAAQGNLLRGIFNWPGETWSVV